MYMALEDDTSGTFVFCMGAKLSELLCKDSDVVYRRRRKLVYNPHASKILNDKIRFEKPESLHQLKDSESHQSRKRCIWCRYLEQDAKTTGSNVYTTKSRVRGMYQYRNVFLCSEDHFGAYHTPPCES